MLRKTCVWMSAALLAAAGLWLAQADGRAQDGDQPANKEKKALTDKEFVQKASASDLTEINTSRLAAQRATNAAVKQFAAKMVMDHTTSSQELATIADKKGLPLAKDMNKMQKEMFEKLSKAEGADFDREYVKGQVMAHEKAVKLFQHASQGLENEELKAFATKTLPIIQMHHKMARQLAGGGQADDHDKGGADKGAGGAGSR